jgi:hypothetical protein
MRHWRILGLAASACAFAFSATPALAHEFTASKHGKITGRQTEESEEAGPESQVFKFGPFHIYCQKVFAKGTVAEGGGKSTFATAIKPSKCLTEAQLSGGSKFKFGLATSFKTELAIEYHANGFVETGSELEEVEGSAKLEGGEAEISVKGGKTKAYEGFKCTIYWPEQTLPLAAVKKPENEYSLVTYADEKRANPNVKKYPDGFQHYIVVHNALKGIKVVFEGEPCEEWGKQETEEQGGGKYTGSFPQILAGGNFEFN